MGTGRVGSNAVVRFTRSRIHREENTVLNPSPMKFRIGVAFLICHQCHETRRCRTRGGNVRRSNSPPGEEEAGAGAGVGELAGAGAGCGGGPATNLRLRSLRRGQLVGTCQGFSARWQIGKMPVPARARSHRVLTTLMEKEESHSKGVNHSLPDLSTATADAPGPPFLGAFLV